MCSALRFYMTIIFFCKHCFSVFFFGRKSLQQYIFFPVWHVKNAPNANIKYTFLGEPNAPQKQILHHKRKLTSLYNPGEKLHLLMNLNPLRDNQNRQREAGKLTGRELFKSEFGLEHFAHSFMFCLQSLWFQNRFCGLFCLQPTWSKISKFNLIFN